MNKEQISFRIARGAFSCLLVLPNFGNFKMSGEWSSLDKILIAALLCFEFGDKEADQGIKEFSLGRLDTFLGLYEFMGELRGKGGPK